MYTKTRDRSEVVIPEFYNQVVEEKKIAGFWEHKRTVHNLANSRQNDNCGTLKLHSGPVFPTGTPHSGHILNSVIKDVFTRYGYMSGMYVESRFGWDTHGLPVEHKVDKKLGIRTTADIEALGITTYNKACREFSKKHVKEWQNIYQKVGNMVNFSEHYDTMDVQYMEKVWGIFKQLYDKEMVYRSSKVQPYSTGCFTNLSNFEAKQNCKEITEVAVVVSVNVVDSEEKLLILTTNPSELMSNFAVCVNPDAVYVKVRVKGVIYIIAKNCLGVIWDNPDDYEVLEEISGKSLQGLEYEPLFEYPPVSDRLGVIMDDSVSNAMGTGILPLNNPTTESLKERGHIVKVAEIKHEKAYCWRSNTPLISRHFSSWFLKVKAIANTLLDNASQVKWSPAEEAKEDFMKWLKEHCNDWAVSRTRYWGTPIPIWSSPSGDEVVCVGSVEELKQLSGKANLEINDLHREIVDWIVIPSRTSGNPPLRRVPEVFDCWFESAIVPFIHETDSFQSEIACEGIDQTYGWFYTTLVMATALSRPPPFRNIFAHGLVIHPDGNKISKRKFNKYDPMHLIEKYGADACRLYLATTPMATGQNFTIQEKGVAYIVEALINPLYRIFSKYALEYGPATEWWKDDDIESWLFSSTESLLQFYESEMKAHRLHTILPRVIKMIQIIESIYIPLMYPKDGPAVTYSGAKAMSSAVYKICTILAPFAPFLTEYIYQTYYRLDLWDREKDSFHDFLISEASAEYIRPSLELTYSRMITVVEFVRTIRTRFIIPFEYKISELIVIHHTEDGLKKMESTGEHIKKLLNVQNVRFSLDHREFGAQLKVKLTYESMFKGNEDVTSALKTLTFEDVEPSERDYAYPIQGYEVPIGDVEVYYEIKEETGTNHTVALNEDLLVVVKMNKELSYYEEGTMLAIENHIKRLRKKGNYFPNEQIVIHYSSDEECLKIAMKRFESRMKQSNVRELKLIEDDLINVPNMIAEAVDIKGMPGKLFLNAKLD